MVINFLLLFSTILLLKFEKVLQFIEDLRTILDEKEYSTMIRRIANVLDPVGQKDPLEKKGETGD